MPFHIRKRHRPHTLIKRRFRPRRVFRRTLSKIRGIRRRHRFFNRRGRRVLSGQKQYGYDFIGRYRTRHGKRVHRVKKSFVQKSLMATMPLRHIIDNTYTVLRQIGGGPIATLLSIPVMGFDDATLIKNDIELGTSFSNNANMAGTVSKYNVFVESNRSECLVKNSGSTPVWLWIWESHPRRDIAKSMYGASASNVPGGTMYMSGNANTYPGIASGQAMANNYAMLSPFRCEQYTTFYKIKNFRKVRLLPGAETRIITELRNKWYNNYMFSKYITNPICQFRGLSYELEIMAVADIFANHVVGPPAVDTPEFSIYDVPISVTQQIRYRVKLEPRNTWFVYSDINVRQTLNAAGNVVNPTVTTAPVGFES